MLPFEFIVASAPISYQTRRPERLHAWKLEVRNAAIQRWPNGSPPLTQKLKITVCYYYDGFSVMDNDNMLKPIQDALNGVLYVDDRQITDTSIRQTDINGRFRVRGMSLVLAEGFATDQEFVHIRLEAAPDHGELL